MSSRSAVVGILLFGAAVAHGQLPPGPPPHDLGPVVATAAVPFRAVSQLVSLSDGRVLVSDATRRVVTMFDGSLANPKVVLDSAGGQRNSFTAGSLLFPFRGDSSFLYERVANVLLVIEPDGKLGRIQAPPPGNSSLLTEGLPTSSPLGLFYRVGARRSRASPPPPGQADLTVRSTDSMLVLRMHYETRSIDTVLALGTGNVTSVTTRADGLSISQVRPALFPFFDDALVMSDGTLAVLRAREYRLDFIAPDGRRTAGPRIPFSWRRITDAERQHVLDSVNTRTQRLYDSLLALRASGAPVRNTAVMNSILGPGGRGTATPPPALQEASDVPDYHPPTARAPMLVDADNHVWLRPSPAVPNTAIDVWDVIDREGRLIERVRVPIDRTIAGFGPGGFVFLVARDAGTATLQKVRVR
jgi:hypothetical protein